MREIVVDVMNERQRLDGLVVYEMSSVDEAIAEILSLVRGIVPPEFKPSGCIENDEAGGFNDCRQAILNEIGEGDDDQE